MADSKKPAKKDADSKEPAETTTTPSHSPITATRRGVATVRPTTPKARGGHGYRKPYETAVSRAARHCSHAGPDISTGGPNPAPTTACLYDLWAAGPTG